MLRRLAPVQHRCGRRCKNLLRLVHFRAAECRQPGDLVQRQFRVELEEAADIGILRIPPVLPVVVRRQHVGIEPYRAGHRLAHLGARRCGQQRRRQCIELALIAAPAQFDAVDDVAPLVGASHLQHASLAPRKLEEIIGLQDHVVEFEEGERLLAVESQLHRIETQHAVDGEMHTIVAQEIDVVEMIQPVSIVDHPRIRGAIAEIEKPPEHLADAGQVGADLLDGEKLPRFVLERGIANLGGAAAHQGDRPVPGLLHPAQHHDLDERSGMQRGGRGIKSNIAADLARHGGGIEPFRVGDLVDESSGRQYVEEVGFELAHRASL